jgi:hypothetical protein
MVVVKAAALIEALAFVRSAAEADDRLHDGDV